jgi:hypothetical protein
MRWWWTVIDLGRPAQSGKEPGPMFVPRAEDHTVSAVFEAPAVRSSFPDDSSTLPAAPLFVIQAMHKMTDTLIKSDQLSFKLDNFDTESQSRWLN